MRGYILESTTTTVHRPGAYSYNQARKFKLLQRACLWILRRLRCEHYDKNVTPTTVTFDTGDVIEMVEKQAFAINKQTHQRLRYVIIGRKQEMQLMGQHYNRQMTFDLSLAQDPQLMGMTLIVAPWFDGVVCLSELS